MQRILLLNNGSKGGIVGAGGDGFPTWETADDTSGQGNGEDITASYPANSAVNDIIVATVSTNTFFELTPAPTDFTSLAGWSGNFQRLRWFWKRYEGTEGATFEMPSTGGVQYRSWRVIRISGAHLTSAPEGVDGVTGTDDSPNPGAITPSWGEAKTLYLVAASIDGAVSVSSYPSGYSNGVSNGTTERLAMASRKLEGTTEDPGVFTLSGSGSWVADVAAFRPA